MEITSDKMQTLVDLILACPSMSSPSGRYQIVQTLSDKVRNSIPYSLSATSRMEVSTIMRTVLNFEDGLQQLIDILQFFDGGTRQFAALQKYIQTDFEDITLRPSSSDEAKQEPLTRSTRPIEATSPPKNEGFPSQPVDNLQINGVGYPSQESYGSLSSGSFSVNKVDNIFQLAESNLENTTIDPEQFIAQIAILEQRLAKEVGESSEDIKNLATVVTNGYYIIGQKHLERGNYPQAIQALFKAKELAKKYEKPEICALALLQLGHAYKSVIALNKSRLAYKDALRLFKQLGDEANIAETNASLAALEIYQGRTSDARKHLEQARQYFAEQGKEKAVEKVEVLFGAADYVDGTLILQGNHRKGN